MMAPSTPHTQRLPGGLHSMRRYTVGPLAVSALAFFAAAGTPSQAVAQPPPDIRGAWSAQDYRLTGGPTHPVRGQIVFTEQDWQVVFFVLDATGAPLRGSAEGGSYERTADGVIFRHLFNLSVGEAMDGLAEAPLRMVVRDPKDAPLEPTRVGVEGDVLTLYFPSGNRMTFLRSGRDRK